MNILNHAYNNGTLKIVLNIKNDDEYAPLSTNDETKEDCDDCEANQEYYLEIEFRDLSNFSVYNTKMTIEDISKIHPLFLNNTELLFDILENKPNDLKIVDNILSLYYILKIGKRKYDIYLNISEKIEEGSNEEVSKLKLQNEYLSKKIYDLEREYKKIMISNILLCSIDKYEYNFELFKKLISTNFNVNCDLYLHSRNNEAMYNILYYVINTHRNYMCNKTYPQYSCLFEYVKLLIDLGTDVNYRISITDIPMLIKLIDASISNKTDNFVDIVELFLDNKYDVSEIDNNKRTLLEHIDFKCEQHKTNPAYIAYYTDVKRVIMKKIGKW